MLGYGARWGYETTLALVPPDPFTKWPIPAWLPTNALHRAIHLALLPPLPRSESFVVGRNTGKQIPPSALDDKAR
jgi:hypothetical protein